MAHCIILHSDNWLDENSDANMNKKSTANSIAEVRLILTLFPIN